MKAQMARGADFESGNLIQRAKAMVPLLVPLFISAFRRATDLAMAMEARCYRGGEGRTKMKPLRYEKRDRITYLVYAGYFLLFLGGQSRSVTGDGIDIEYFEGSFYETDKNDCGIRRNGLLRLALQPNGVTIEEILNGTLSELLKEPVCVIGASRTDSGVHALGNVAVFDTESRIPGEKLCYAVNQKLPEDIRVLESEEVPLDWHPRKQNSVKTYEYKILNCRISVPTRRLYAHFCYYSLDVEKMRQAAAYLLGEHDFSSFCSSGHQAEETVRTLYDISVDRGTDDIITIRLKGSGFLYIWSGSLPGP